MIEYVLDTNSVSEFMRGRPNASLESQQGTRAPGADGKATVTV